MKVSVLMDAIAAKLLIDGACEGCATSMSAASELGGHIILWQVLHGTGSTADSVSNHLRWQDIKSYIVILNMDFEGDRTEAVPGILMRNDGATVMLEATDRR